MKDLYDSMIKRNPKLARGKVWCLKCGREQTVNPKVCLANKWPTCCDQTMSLDSPEERKKS